LLAALQTAAQLAHLPTFTGLMVFLFQD